MLRNPSGIFLQKPMRNGVWIRSWNIWGYMRFSHQGRERIGPNFRKTLKNTSPPTPSNFDDADIDTFIALRPDGLAFDMEEKLCVFLEYTRAMDTNEDWAEKEQEKNDRYSSLLGFINHLSHREKSGWKASQTNFTTGVRGSLHTN